jgi:hypothetical protein
MAGDWIKMRQNLGSDPDVIEIACKLSLDEFGVVGRLHAVWSWLDQHSDDGTNVRIVSAFLDRLTACPGFADAMRAVGWLDGRDGALTFPGYQEHNGETAKRRATEAKRKADQRDKRDKCPTQNGTHVPDTPGPEKRRVEKNRIPPTPQGGFVGGDDVVEGIYQLYPRKVAKRQTALHAVRMALIKIDAKTLRAAVVRYARTPGLDREDGRFIPSPIDWFSQEGWKDYLPKPSAPQVHVPVPSKALGDVRVMFGRKLDLSPEERALTLKFIEAMTPEDDKLLTSEERSRIATMKVIS